MAEALLTFLPVAALLTVLPGPATALVVQSAFRGGRPEALRTFAGNHQVAFQPRRKRSRR